MAGEVSWVCKVQLNDGVLDEFRPLVAEMNAAHEAAVRRRDGQRHHAADLDQAVRGSLRLRVDRSLLV